MGSFLAGLIVGRGALNPAEIGAGGDGLRPIDFGRGFIEDRGKVGLVVHRWVPCGYLRTSVTDLGFLNGRVTQRFEESRQPGFDRKFLVDFIGSGIGKIDHGVGSGLDCSLPAFVFVADIAGEVLWDFR